ncbi:hypothetical protein NG42_13110 [Winslowiella iniecta]|uniref:Uncharacterized protein n=2 Tax=Winslowiella iniecta TaxID=1560201 RepID=A0A0L7T1Q1_9GAMM|nr:hypothetical protein NG42_13110 [Winslowiella iniecta]KOC94831.1 hypothetical protein NG43_03370 [Winslowiella iniecta]
MNSFLTGNLALGLPRLLLKKPTLTHHFLLVDHPIKNLRLLKVIFLSFLFTTFPLFLSGCSGSYKGIQFKDTTSGLNPPAISARDGVVYLDGKINSDTYDQLADLLNQQDIRRLSINSTGGDVEAALKIARVIFEKKMDVEVRSLCASSCANYIFPAGQYKIIHDYSIIIWHGSMNSPAERISFNENSGGMTKKEFLNLKEFKSFQREERQFYQKIGVDYRMPFCPQLRKDFRKHYPEGSFSYSIQNMKKFGVENIFFSESPSHWHNTMREKGVIFASYCKKD